MKCDNRNDYLLGIEEKQYYKRNIHYQEFSRQLKHAYFEFFFGNGILLDASLPISNLFTAISNNLNRNHFLKIQINYLKYDKRCHFETIHKDLFM